MNSFGLPAQADRAKRRAIAMRAISGATIAVLTAVAAHYIGVQQLLRIPNVALFLPAGILGGLMGPTRLRPLLWIAAGPIAVVSVAVTYTPLVSALAEPLVRRDPIPSRVDAIAALSQGLTPDGQMRGATLDHLLSALELARDRKASAVLVSQERRTFSGRSVTDSADLWQIVRTFAVPVEVIFVDSVITTRTEALRARAIASQRGWSTIAVVTSPLHSRRACATFEAVGFKVVCVPALSRQHVVPEARHPEDRLRTFRSWLYETFAGATYKSNGWIR
ncbi:MAG: YdcF family protein [Gemmatimonadaceae bacterium]